MECTEKTFIAPTKEAARELRIAFCKTDDYLQGMEVSSIRAMPDGTFAFHSYRPEGVTL